MLVIPLVGIVVKGFFTSQLLLKLFGRFFSFRGIAAFRLLPLLETHATFKLLWLVVRHLQ